MSQIIDPQFIDKLQTAFNEGDENVAEKSEEAANVRRVEEVFRIIASKDFDSLKNFFAEDVTLEIIGSPSTPFDVMKTGLDTQVMIFTDDCFFQFSTTEIFNDFSENVPRQLGCPSCYMVCNDRFLIGLPTGCKNSCTNLGHHGFTVDQKD